MSRDIQSEHPDGGGRIKRKERVEMLGSALRSLVKIGLKKEEEASCGFEVEAGQNVANLRCEMVWNNYMFMWM